MHILLIPFIETLYVIVFTRQEDNSTLTVQLIDINYILPVLFLYAVHDLSCSLIYNLSHEKPITRPFKTKRNICNIKFARATDPWAILAFAKMKKSTKS